MAMPVSDANAVNTLLHWAMGHRVSWPGGPVITDEAATEASRQLAGKANKALSAGLFPDQVRLRSAATVRARLIRAAAGEWGPLTEAELNAVGDVVDLIDRIEQAAAAARKGS